MTLRSELEKVLAMGHEIPTVNALNDFVELTTAFLRDHGPALLEAVKDQERYDWVYRTCVLVTKGRGMFVEFPIPYSAASLELSAAIDAARGDA